MFDEFATIDHHIQRHILDVLRRHEFARFRDMRPPAVDSNAYSYHLSRLIRQDYITKAPSGYTLSIKGLAYIDRMTTDDGRLRRQPKIMTATVIADPEGQVLVRRKRAQPMINQVTLPTGMLHMDDSTVEAAARREVLEKMGITLPADIRHIGDCYMAIRHDGQVMMNTLIHVFYAPVWRSDIALHDGIFWRAPGDLADAAPATRHIVASLDKLPTDGLFFAEYSEDL